MQPQLDRLAIDNGGANGEATISRLAHRRGISCVAWAGVLAEVRKLS
jgi:hypothetical protein